MFGLGVFVEGVGSFFLLVLASWCVGEGGEILGKKYDASVIGGLVIAWLNTAPETIFFITALKSDNPRFAVGAVSGSSIVVCTVALGACLWIGSNARKSGLIILQPAVKKQCQILGASTIVTLAIVATGFTIPFGIVGVGFYLWFMYYSLQHKEIEEDSKQQDEEAGETSDEEEEDVPVTKGAAYLAAGGILIIVFSTPFIESVVETASALKVNPILLAFFLAPIASEAPEILESISLSRKGNATSINVAYSNLIGGTITKTTLLCGIFCFFGVYKNFTWESPSYTLSLMLLTICAASAASIGAFVKQQTKWHGAVLFALFLLTGILQYTTNSHFEEEVFPDEGFAHDDAHTGQVQKILQTAILSLPTSI
jgi:Ca2+/Na+ antiporter